MESRAERKSRRWVLMHSSPDGRGRISQEFLLCVKNEIVDSRGDWYVEMTQTIDSPWFILAGGVFCTRLAERRCRDQKVL